MWSARVVELQISTQGFSCSRYAVIGAQIDLFIFDRPPQPFDKDIVPPCAFTVHADLDVGILQRLDEVYGRELAALVRIHDLGLAVATHRFFQGLDAWSGFQRRRQPPGEDLPAKPIQHGDQIDKAARHGDIGNVHGPNLVRAHHGQLSQQIGIDLVAGGRFRRVGPAIERLDAHLFHAGGHV